MITPARPNDLETRAGWPVVAAICLAAWLALGAVGWAIAKLI